MRTFLDKISGPFAKYLAIFFASLFVLATVLVIIFFNIENTLLNAGTYKRALDKNNVYGQLPVLAEAEMDAMKSFFNDLSGAAIEDMDFMDDLTSKDWQTLFNFVLPADDARGMIENMLDQVFATINGEADSARLPVAALKARFNGQAGKDSIQYLLNIQPPCTEEQLTLIHSEKPNLEDPEYCQPPQQDLALLTSQWQAKIASTSADIPDEIMLIQPPSNGLGNGAPGTDPIAGLNTARLLIRFSPLLPLVLLVLITLLRVRSLKSWLTWWGVPLLITGLIALAIGLFLPVLLNWAVGTAILSRFSSVLSAGVSGLAGNLVRSVAQALATPITVEAAITGLLGLAATIGSFFVEPKLKEPVPLAAQVVE